MTWLVYPLVAAGLFVIFGLSRLTAAVPSPLVAVVALTLLTVSTSLTVPTVADQGALPSSLPVLGLPAVPFTLDTLTTIAPYALSLALVGLMESLMTARLVDDITDSRSDKTRESCGQGVANIVTGLFGGMGGCAMIGQTMINVGSGARTRLSTFLAGGFLLVLVVVLGGVVSLIPMAALVAVMVLVSVSTFDWHSIAPATLRRMPRSETAVMLVTVAVVVPTGNLSYGVVAGTLTAMALFARRVAHLVEVERVVAPDGASVVHHVTGQVFFASTNDLVEQFDVNRDPARVLIDMSRAHIWDASSVAALGAVEARYGQRGTTVALTGLDQHSAAMHGRLAGELSGGH